MTDSNKRSADSPDDLPPVKRRMRSDTPAAASKPEQPSKWQEVKPFQLPEELDALRPSDILGLHGFSRDIYNQDLFAIFAASPATPSIIAMHKAWANYRKPTVEELWTSRYPETGSRRQTIPGEVLRKVKTLEIIAEKATNQRLVEEVERLLVDHLMLMCVSWKTLEVPEKNFPNCQVRFGELVSKYGAAQSSRQRSAKVSQIAPEIRSKVESLRIDAKSVVQLEQISGNQQAKKAIETAMFIPTEVPHLAIPGGGAHGILLHGPPGTGKTLLAMASAAQSEHCRVYSANTSDLIDRFQGSSEQNIAGLFAIAADDAPAVIILDEVEGLCRSRKSNSSSEGIIGTTNLPWMLDQAFGRRFRKIHVGLPNESELIAIVQGCLKKCRHRVSREHMEQLARECKGFTGDAITQVINAAWEELIYEIASADYFQAVTLEGVEMFRPCESTSNGSFCKKFSDFKQDGMANKVIPSELTIERLLEHAVPFKTEVAASIEANDKHARWASKQFYD
ncbi:vacuolar protein sorting-associated protein [Physcia stellaris]|nr:vacuolar protein sorting-associated protein [Physcia stellaris]